MINASFWSFASLGPYIAMIPYTQNGSLTGPYLWSNQGSAGAGNFLAIPAGAPGCRVGGVVGQFLMVGDLYQTITTPLFTGDASKKSFSGSIAAPMTSSGSIFDAQGTLSGGFSNGNIIGTGYLTSGTINYATGSLSLSFGTAPGSGDIVYCTYTQAAPYRVWWSAIGDPTNWPIPLTQAALAAQSGYQDNQVNLGQVMFIAGYPQYALIFQRFGITRANYIGGGAVFQFAPYEFARGCVSHGAVIQISNYVFFLADEGWTFTDGANVYPFGESTDDSSGIDNWFWANVNTNALESIRCGYDAVKRCVFFAIPTGGNTLPDTLLSFNILAQKWTRASVATETIWTADNGEDNSAATRQTLGLFSQAHVPQMLNGSPLTGYMESCDVMFTDAMRRLTTSVRPHVNSTDNPLITVGVRESLQDPVTYGASNYTDVFARTAPALSSGIYTRVRTSSTNASSIHGATLNVESEGSI